MRLTDLQDAIVRTLDGEKLGRVHEVHCDGGRIIAIMCGPGSLIERLTAQTKGRRIAWKSVKRVEHKLVTVALDESAPSASRSRQRTRRPSAPRSKR
jgi:sporulation protein YlmC with PRC-barrel domain